MLALMCSSLPGQKKGKKGMFSKQEKRKLENLYLALNKLTFVNLLTWDDSQKKKDTKEPESETISWNFSRCFNVEFVSDEKKIFEWSAFSLLQSSGFYFAFSLSLFLSLFHCSLFLFPSLHYSLTHNARAFKGESGHCAGRR